MNPKLLSVVFLLSVTAASAAVPYVEASVGYLLDSKKALVGGRVGCEIANTAGISHQLEFEVARTTDSEFGIRLTLLPLLVNYRFTSPMGPMTDFFGGAGLGITRAKLSGFGRSETDEPFSGQLFTGIAFKVAPTVAITTAVRYLRIEKAEFFGFRDKIGDDLSLEAGVRFRF